MYRASANSFCHAVMKKSFYLKPTQPRAIEFARNYISAKIALRICLYFKRRKDYDSFPDYFTPPKRRIVVAICNKEEALKARKPMFEV
jgi:hypothetical protein